MSTKNVTTSALAFDPTSMGTYQGLQGGLGSAISSYMTNPFSNPFFQTQQQMGTNQANLLGGTNLSNIARNWTASGMGGSQSPAMLEMMNNQMRANSGMRAQLGFLNPMQNAFTAQQNAMGLASQYRPLQTGGTQTQTQSGVGSWLPQLAGAALGMAGGALTGGMSTALTGTAGAMRAATSPMQSPFLSPQFGSMGGGLQMGTGAPDVGGYNMEAFPSPFAQPTMPSSQIRH